MSGRYQCWCTRCDGSKECNRRTIEQHILADRDRGIINAWQTGFVPYHVDSDPFFPKRTSIGKLLADPTDPRNDRLHPNTNITRLEFLTTILEFNAEAGLSVKSADRLLEICRSIVGPTAAYSIPRDLKEVKDSLQDVTVKHKTYVFCENDHPNTEVKSVCITCGADLKSDPIRKYHHFPIIPRLQQLYDIPAVAEALEKQPTRQLHTTAMWQEGTEDGTDALLSYCSDGFNPFHHIMKKGTYSIWAQAAELLNVPPTLAKSIPKLLIGMIPGPKMEIDMRCVTQIVVKEFKELERGVVSFNAHRMESFTLRAKIGMFILDIPGAAKELGHLQQNAAKACPRCDTEGTYSKTLGKMVYPDSRRFLDMDDSLRKDNQFPLTSTEERPPPDPRLCDRELIVGQAIDDLVNEQRSNPEARLASAIRSLSKVTGRSASTPWQDLGLDVNIKQLPVEPMHMIKGIGCSLVKLINGEEVSQKVITYEEELGRFQSSNNKKRRLNKETSGNIQAFTLTEEEKVTADCRLKSIIFPDGFGDIPTALFQKVEGKTKSHTWLQLMTSGTLTYCLRGMLGSTQEETLAKFLFNVSRMFDTMAPTDVDEREWHGALAMMERDFPLSIRTINFHIAHHLPYYVRRFGPVNNFWMFGFERFNGTLIDAITSRQHPEKSAMNIMESQWLIAILKCCGLFSDSFPKAKETRQKPVPQVTKDEIVRLGLIQHESDVVAEKKIVHIKRNEFGEITYRGAFTNKSPSVVAIKVNSNYYCGTIVKFYICKKSVIGEIEWLGQIKMCERSNLYFIVQQKVNCKRFVNMELVSTPLVHAKEDGIFWILSLHM